ncbi:MAG: SDR family oxidoreductase [Spirochaetes bacterium]|nr:SDR family oxidoreductase [Spirochaetota bacterium]
MNNLFTLQGKIALITGSSRGLGFTIAKGLGLAGAIVILNGRNENALKEAKQKLINLNIKCYCSTFDVISANEIDKQITLIEKEIGQIDILVNNAGVQARAPLENFEETVWNNIINTHLTGAFLVSKRVAKSMISNNYGKIINICSLMSEIGRASIAPYTAAKGGLKNLTKAMAVEWAKYNIQINGIGPGYFLTEMTKNLMEDQDFDIWLKKRTPAGRWGDPEELVGAAIFLASKASSFVNGQIIYVDGGILASI